MSKQAKFRTYSEFSPAQRWYFKIAFRVYNLTNFPLPIAIAPDRRKLLDSLNTILGISQIRYAHETIYRESQGAAFEIAMHDRHIRAYAIMCNILLAIIFLFLIMSMPKTFDYIFSRKDFWMSYTVTATTISALKSENAPSALADRVEGLIGKTFSKKVSLISAIGETVDEEVAAPYIPSIVENCETNFHQLRYVLFFPTSLLAYFVITFILFRIVLYYMNKRYASTLCVYAAYGITLDLLDSRALISPDKRRRLQSRISQIAEHTLFLKRKYASRDPAISRWESDHFSGIVDFIKERERWVIAPIDKTLEDLRRDFSNLMEIYLYGRYGDPALFSINAQGVQREVAVGRSRKSLLRSVSLSLGVLLPLVLMGLYLLAPEIFPSLSLSADVIALIFISWLLLAIDGALDLGIVKNLIALANGIRGLR